MLLMYGSDLVTLPVKLNLDIIIRYIVISLYYIMWIKYNFLFYSTFCFIQIASSL